jgi:hypothetical protein
MSPYLFGMFAAHKLNTDDSLDNAALDWLSFFAFIAIYSIGA